jgi:hypothetical protein
MKRVVQASPCVVLLLAATCSSVMVHSAWGDTGRSVAAAASKTVEPVCARVDAGTEPCATRYPKQYLEWQESVHGRAYLSGDTDAPGCSDCHDDPESAEIRTPVFRLEIPSRCARCHDDEKLMRKHDIATDLYASYRADFHGFTIDHYRLYDASMWRYEAVCSDCHASHAVFRAGDARSSVAPANLLDTCRQCHPGAEANFTSITTGHFRTDRRSSLLVYLIKLIYQILIPTVIGLMTAYIALDIVHRLRRKFAGTNAGMK